MGVDFKGLGSLDVHSWISAAKRFLSIHPHFFDKKSFDKNFRGY